MSNVLVNTFLVFKMLHNRKLFQSESCESFKFELSSWIKMPWAEFLDSDLISSIPHRQEGEMYCSTCSEVRACRTSLETVQAGAQAAVRARQQAAVQAGLQSDTALDS